MLTQAKLATHAALRLWTFQHNTRARTCHEANGFRLLRTTPGDNGENEPDVLYEWRATPPVPP